jgi:hypothetical protein
MHDRVPCFWSDQFDLELIIIGVGYGCDTTIVHGSPATRSFSICYLRNGELVALDSINAAKDQMAASKLTRCMRASTWPGSPILRFRSESIRRHRGAWSE